MVRHDQHDHTGRTELAGDPFQHIDGLGKVLEYVLHEYEVEWPVQLGELPDVTLAGFEASVPCELDSSSRRLKTSVSPARPASQDSTVRAGSASDFQDTRPFAENRSQPGFPW